MFFCLNSLAHLGFYQLENDIPLPLPEKATSADVPTPTLPNLNSHVAIMSSRVTPLVPAKCDIRPGLSLVKQHIVQSRLFSRFAAARSVHSGNAYVATNGAGNSTVALRSTRSFYMTKRPCCKKEACAVKRKWCWSGGRFSSGAAWYSSSASLLSQPLQEGRGLIHPIPPAFHIQELYHCLFRDNDAPRRKQ